MKMAMDETSNVDERISKKAIKPEANWLSGDLHRSNDLQEFVEELDPLQSNNTEHSHVDAETHVGHVLTIAQQTSQDAYKSAKAELILYEEFLEDKNDAYSTVSAQEYEQCHLQAGDDQHAKATQSGEDSELSHSFTIKPVQGHMSQSRCERTSQYELSQSFVDKIDRLRHSKIHDDNLPRNYACGQCNFKCLDINSLKSHIRTHNKKRSGFSCQLCKKRFRSKYGFNTHMNTHNGVTHNCELCGRSFLSKENLKRHMMYWHTCEASSDNQRNKCKNGDKDLVNSCRPYTRIARTHKIYDKETVDALSQKVSTTKGASKEVQASLYITTEVERSRTEAEVNAVQLLTSETQTSNDAVDCVKTELPLDEEFLDDKNVSDSDSNAPDNQLALDIHAEQQGVVSVADNSTEINTLSHNIYSGSSYRDKNKFTHHMKIRNDNRPRKYACGQCGLKFSKRASLERHLITHDKKEFKCKSCEKVYNSAGGLVVHMKLHTGDTHNCDLCGARFPTKLRLQRHMLSCGKTYSISKLYKCTLCDKHYAYTSSLKVHYLEHTGLPWKCSICAKEFAEKIRVRRHLNRVHKIVDKEGLKELILNVATAKDL